MSGTGINPRVLRRFIILMAVLTLGMFSFWAFYGEFFNAPPGDYETRQGDILLGEKKYDEAIERFDAALTAMPNHRGALMGRAIALLQSGRIDEAEAEFTHVITFLEANLEPDDPTGTAVLAGAFANRGILYDRTERYEQALADYIESLKVDEDAVSGPDVVQKILYGDPKPSTVRKRAQYLYEQLQLPESERLMRVPELDADQRMHKP